MVELIVKQQEKIENLKKIYVSFLERNKLDKNDILQKQLNFFEDLLKSRIIFKIKLRDKDLKKDSNEQLFSLFKGNKDYYVTTRYIIDGENPRGGEHIELNYNPESDKYYFQIRIKMIKDKILVSNLNDFINSDKNYSDDNSREFDSFEELIKHSNKLDDFIKSKNITINKISFQELESAFEKRLNKFERNLKYRKDINNSNNAKNYEKKESSANNNLNNILQIKKQIILYGPPGTGKTYNTKKIIFNWNKENLLENDTLREDIEKNYSQLEQEGRIKFITFHQSYAYEEFIEGLKPIINDEDNNGEITYEFSKGIFKEFCEKAILDKIKDSDLFQVRKDEILNFENGYNNLIKEINNSNEDILELKTKTGKKFGISINTKNNLNLHTGKEMNKQGVLTKENLEKEFNKEVIFQGWESYFNIVLEKINNYIKKENSNDVNIFNEKNVKKNLLEEFYKLSKNQRDKIFENEKPYFLIIDEINRGNISKILGELITLLEADKRLGQDNELIVELPYSKEKFGIPPNLYIIATMNTTDKSIANLDLALRRRFGFVEMLPQSKLLEKDYENLSEENIKYYNSNDEIKLNKLLEKINQRIEYLIDKDHTIGHSYFMKVDSIEKLQEVFYNEIIPLLEEYFYGDLEKLKHVLGSGFVIENKYDENLFEDKNKIENGKENFEIIDFKKDKNIEGFTKAINKIIPQKEKNPSNNSQIENEPKESEATTKNGEE